MVCGRPASALPAGFPPGVMPGGRLGQLFHVELALGVWSLGVVGVESHDPPSSRSSAVLWRDNKGG